MSKLPAAKVKLDKKRAQLESLGASKLADPLFCSSNLSDDRQNGRHRQQTS